MIDSRRNPFLFIAGLICFGSFTICGEQNELKRVIYIEVVCSLEKVFFLLTLRTFIRRGANIQEMRLDNKSNFLLGSERIAKTFLGHKPL